MTNGNKKYCSTCSSPYFERNNYYCGKLMTARDFQDEQCYFNEKRWLINRMIHGWGVVCGLDVRRKPKNPNDPNEGFDDKYVQITPGMAIDCCGREIFLNENWNVKLPPEKTNASQQIDPDEKKFIICLEYFDCKTEKVNIPTTSCESKEKYGYNRIRDSFNIFAKEEERIGSGEVKSRRICPLENKSEYLFNWDEITENDYEKNLLLEFLEKTYNVDWIRTANIKKTDKTIEISNEINALSLTLINGKVQIIINDGRTDELIVKQKNDMHCIFKTETVHHFLCKKLKEGCHECDELSCQVLAEVTVDPTADPPITIDNCSKRRLIYSNPLLHELIDCYHGDLPHIVGINWKENGAEISWDDFADDKGIYNNGVQVEFDLKMNGDTINENTFLFLVKMKEPDTGNYVFEHIPGEVEYNESTLTATKIIDSKWLVDVFFGFSRIQEKGAEFMVVLKGDFIISSEENNKPVKALDGNCIGGKLPSGKGTEGGDFESWFSIPKPGIIPEPPETAT